MESKTYSTTATPPSALSISVLPHDAPTPVAVSADRGKGPMTISATKPTGLLKSEAWTVTLDADAAIFANLARTQRITVTRENANVQIAFQESFSFFPGNAITVQDDDETHAFNLNRDGRIAMRAWLPRKTRTETRAELRKWGVGLLVLAVVHLALPEVLDPAWGVVIAVIGCLNLLLPRRGMFIVNGVALLVVGLANLSVAGASGWKAFALMQFIWGVQEIRKYGQYE